MLYRFFRFLFRCFFAFFYRLESTGQHHIPSDGGVILCANHISYFDPPIVGSPVNRKVHYMAKEELFRIPIFGWLIRQFGAFPVKRGGVSRESIRHSIRLLKSGQMMGVFPEGSRNAGGMGKKGAASLALKSNAVVIPVGIVGSYRIFTKMKVVYGKPVDLSEFAEDGSSLALEQATAKIMAAIQTILHENIK